MGAKMSVCGARVFPRFSVVRIVAAGLACAFASCAAWRGPATSEGETAPLLPLSAVASEEAASPEILWMRSLDQSRRWTAAPAHEYGADVSPDASLLAYVSDAAGNDDIYLLHLPPARPRPPRQLAGSAAREYAPRFSPNGKQVAYVSTLDDAFGDIWVVAVRSGQTRRLTGRETRDASPAWMPDGKSLIFSSAAGDAPAALWKISVDTGRREALNIPTPDAMLEPDVAPDGQRIAFVSVEPVGGVRRLAVFDLQTGDIRYPMGAHSIPVYTPRFTPDGRAIVVAGLYDDTNGDGLLDERDNRILFCVETPAGQDGGVFYPLTVSSASAAWPAPFRGGFFFSRSADPRSPADLFSFGEEGAVPLPPADRMLPAVERLAIERPNEEDLLLCAWRQIGYRDQSGAPDDLRPRAFLEETRLLRRLGRLNQAGERADYLARTQPPQSLWAGLALVERERILLLQTERATADAGRLTAARRRVLEALEGITAAFPASSETGVEARLLAARVHADLGDHRQAIAVTDDLLVRFGGDARVMARTLLLRGSIQEDLAGELTQSYERVLTEFSMERREAFEAARRILNLLTETGAPRPPEEKRRLLRERMALPGTPPLLAAAARNRIGDLFAEENRLAEALDAFQETIESFPQEIEAAAAAHFALSRVLYAQGRYAESVRVYERIERRLRPRDDSFYHLARRGYIRQTLRKAEAEYRAQDPALARATFADLLEYDPSIMEAWRGVLRSDHALGRVPETLSEIEARLVEQPDHAALRYARGLALTYLPRGEKRARRDLEAASVLDPASPYPHQTLGYLFEQEMSRRQDREAGERALYEYQLALALTDSDLVPDNAAALVVNAGHACRLLGLWGLAQQYYAERVRQIEQAGERQPFEDPQTAYLFWRHAGEAAFKAGDPAESASHYAKALETLPLAREKEETTTGRVNWEEQKTELLDRRALALQESEQFAEAAALFSEVAARAETPQGRALAARNHGVNLYLSARDLPEPEKTERLREAWASFASAMESVERVGVLAPETRRERGSGLLNLAVAVGLGGEAGTGAGHGFDEQGERRLLDGFLGWISETRGDSRAAAASLRKQIAHFPKITDANRAYVLTEKAVLWSRLAALEEQMGNLEEAARATMESLACCHWRIGTDVSINTHGAAIAAMNLARLWALDEKVIPEKAGESWLAQRESADEADRAGLVSEIPAFASHAVLRRLLKNARALLETSPPPPAAVLLPDLAFHQGIIELRLAEMMRVHEPALSDPLFALRQSADFAEHAMQARKYFAEALATGTASGTMKTTPEDRERRRRIEIAAMLREADALRALGRADEAEQTAARGLEAAALWGYEDLAFAARFERGFEETHRADRLPFWADAAETGDAMPGATRSGSVLFRAARTTLAAAFAREAAEQEDWESAWRWVEWPISQDLSMTAGQIIAETGDAKNRGLGSEWRVLRSEAQETWRRWRRSTAPTFPAPPGLTREAAALRERAKALLKTAEADAPELWSFWSGRPLSVGDILDFLPPDSAMLRLAWLDDAALAICADPESLRGTLLADSDGRIAELLKKGASSPAQWTDADLDTLSEWLRPVWEMLGDAETVEIFPDAVFSSLPLEALPDESGVPFFTKRRLSWNMSVAHRYLCQTRLVPWRSRLLEIGVSESDAPVGAGVFPWKRSLDAAPSQVLDAGRNADLIRFNWPLWLSGFHPESGALSPEGREGAPGSDLRVGELFSAAWSVSCAGFERVALADGASRGGQMAALDLFLTGLAWGGCPVAVLGPSDFSDAVSDGASRQQERVWRARESHRASVWQRFWEGAASASPAAALQEALKQACDSGVAPLELAGFRVWGHPGLSGEAAALFASDEFEDRLGRAVAAHKEQNWPAAARFFEQALLLLQMIDPDDPQVPLIAQFMAEDADLAGEYELGVRAARQITAVREKASAPVPERAAAWLLEGILLSKAQRHAEAAESARRAVQLYQETEEYLETLDALGQLGVVLENGHEYEEALDAYRSARDLCADLEAPDEEARQWRRMARVLALRLGRYGDAERAARSALQLYADLEDQNGEAETLLDLGMIAERRAEFDAALSFYDRAETIAAAIGDNALAARAALNQANTHWFTGNYLECLLRQKAALEAATQSRRAAVVLAAHNTAGLLYWALNDYDRAMAEFNQALGLSRANRLSAEEASTLNNMGLVWRSRADYPKAIETFESALALDRAMQSSWGQAYDHRNIGMTHLLAGDLNAAVGHLSHALEISRALGDLVNAGKALLSLGDAEQKQGRDAPARLCYEEALAISRERRIPEVEWRALQGLAALEKTAGERASAIRILDEAIGVVERMRASIRVEELQDGFLADKQGLYEQMILMLLDEGKAEEAFEYSERARGRGFIDLLGNQKIELGNEADQQLLERERILRQDMDRLRSELAAAESEARSVELTNEIEALGRSLADLHVEIRAKNPALSAFVSVDPISLEELHQLLGNEVALIEYFLAEKETVIWVIRNGRVHVVRVPGDRAELADRVTTYRRRIQIIENVEELSRFLYERLLAPVAPLIQDSPRLAIVPHHVLHYLSFASLSDKSGHVIDRHALFYLPSAGVYRYTHARRRPDPNPRVLAIGNPDLGNPHLDLPFAEKEAERLIWQFPRVDVLTREKATEQWVRENAGDYGIVHIASHGEFDSANPLFSAIMLAPDELQDGNLTVREIFSLSVNADLVTLSACQSGLAKINNGDDLVGLNRAFVYAGTHAILGSLWRVDDVATAVLIKHFYRHYGETDKAESLRRAQIQVRRFQPHPAYWAGLALSGDWK